MEQPQKAKARSHRFGVFSTKRHALIFSFKDWSNPGLEGRLLSNSSTIFRRDHVRLGLRGVSCAETEVISPATLGTHLPATLFCVGKETVGGFPCKRKPGPFLRDHPNSHGLSHLQARITAVPIQKLINSPVVSKKGHGFKPCMNRKGDSPTKETTRAGILEVIPILLPWQASSFAKLQFLPT